MAKKLSKFGAAFKAAKDGSVFDFNGKKYKKEYAKSPKKSGGSKLPATTSVTPTPRPGTASGKRSPFSPTHDRGTSSTALPRSSNSPTTRGGKRGSKPATPSYGDDKSKTRQSSAYIANTGAKAAKLKMLKGMK